MMNMRSTARLKRKKRNRKSRNKMLSQSSKLNKRRQHARTKSYLRNIVTYYSGLHHLDWSRQKLKNEILLQQKRTKKSIRMSRGLERRDGRRRAGRRRRKKRN
jgi:hypothetical protein